MKLTCSHKDEDLYFADSELWISCVFWWKSHFRIPWSDSENLDWYLVTKLVTSLGHTLSSSHSVWCICRNIISMNVTLCNTVCLCFIQFRSLVTNQYYYPCRFSNVPMFTSTMHWTAMLDPFPHTLHISSPRSLKKFRLLQLRVAHFDEYFPKQSTIFTFDWRTFRLYGWVE